MQANDKRVDELAFKPDRARKTDLARLRISECERKDFDDELE